MDLSLQEPTGEPLKEQTWKLVVDEATNAQIAVLTASDSVRNVTIKVGLVEETDEIFLQFDGKSSKPGLQSMFFGLQGFSPVGGKFLIPGQAGISFDADTNPSQIDITYPTHWEAQFAIYQRKAGGVLIYARDPKPYFKRLRATRQYGTLDLGLDVFAVAPWSKATETPAVEWRFKTFSGDWKQGVDHYKSWSNTAWHTRQLPPAADWRKEVNTVITFVDTVVEYLDPLALRVDPKKTLIYLANWRRDPYDTNYPDYTPGASTAAFIRRAHELGFHVMLHANALGVATYHPIYAETFQYQLRDPDNGDPLYWPQGLWPAGSLPPFFLQSFAFISPASSEYRQILINALRPMMAELRPDALHLDAGGVMLNDGNGLVEGMTSMEGMVRLHEDLDRAFPGTIFSYESMTEVLTGLQNYAQRWNASYPAHPISTYLMGDKVTFYGFLNQTPPDQPGFIDFMKRYEGQGVVPTFHVAGSKDLSGALPGNEGLLHILELWQKYDFRPDWENDWGTALFRYISADGATTAVLEEENHVVRLRIGEDLIYERIRGTTTATVDGLVRNWPAYDGTTLYGLDPKAEYWLDRGVARPQDMVRLSGLPDGVSLGLSSFSSADYGYFEFHKNQPAAYDFIQQFQIARRGTSYVLHDLPMGLGASAEVTRTIVSGKVYSPVIAMRPPYRLPGAVVFIEYDVAVPVNNPRLSFSAGISDFAVGSDGCWFVARIDGVDIWKADLKVGQVVPASVDLSRWAGKTVKLRLLVHPGAQLNSAADLAIWDSLAIESSEVEAPTKFRIELPPGTSGNVQVSRNVRLEPADGDSLSAEAALPASFAVFAKPPAEMKLGDTLLDLPLRTWNSYYGGLPFESGESPNGQIIGAKSGGEEVARALLTFPPSNGLTYATWAVSLPKDATKLTFRAALADPAPPLPEKIDYSTTAFKLKINGEELWSEVYQTNGWHDLAIDISEFAGGNALIEISADAMGIGSFNWAQWADLSVR